MHDYVKNGPDAVKAAEAAVSQPRSTGSRVAEPTAPDKLRTSEVMRAAAALLGSTPLAAELRVRAHRIEAEIESLARSDWNSGSLSRAMSSARWDTIGFIDDAAAVRK